jgi:alcohol dehydrogenase YqhD (iron-dependent ADH family)
LQPGARWGRSKVFNVAGGDVVGWVGVKAQVPIVGVTEASFQFSPVVAAGFREPVAEGVPQVVRAEDPEMALAVGGLGVVDTAYLPDDGVD